MAGFEDTGPGRGCSRRSFLAGAGGLSALVVGGGLSSGLTIQSSGADWPMHCYGPGNNTYVPDRAGPGPGTAVTNRWVFDSPDDEPGIPVVRNGTAYFGDGSPSVYAVRVSDGGLAWETSLDVGLLNSPVVYDGTVYVVTRDGRVYGLDPESGSRSWVTRLDLGGYATEIRTSPTVAEGTLLVQADATLRAIDLDTGDRRWTAGVESTYRHVGHAVGDGSVVFVGDDGALRSVALADGTEQWSLRLRYDGGEFMTAPVVADGWAYCGSARTTTEPENGAVGFHAVELATGDRRWQHVVEGLNVIDDLYPVVGRNYVYFDTAQYERDGTEVTPYNRGNRRSSAFAPFDGTYVHDVSTFDAQLYVKEPVEDGVRNLDLLALEGIDTAPRPGVVLLDGVFLVRTDGGKLAAFEFDPPSTTTAPTTTRSQGGGGGPPGVGTATGTPPGAGTATGTPPDGRTATDAPPGTGPPPGTGTTRPPGTTEQPPATTPDLETQEGGNDPADGGAGDGGLPILNRVDDGGPWPWLLVLLGGAGGYAGYRGVERIRGDDDGDAP